MEEFVELDEHAVNTTQLATLIDAKHSVLARLRELAERQLAHIHERNNGALVSMLAVKQKLLDELTAIEKQLDPYRSEDPDRRNWPSPAHRTRCAQVAAACRELLDELMRLDQQGMQHLRAQQQTTMQELHSAQESATARSAYLAATPAAPNQFDLTSET